MALMQRQVPWVGFVAVAMMAALLTSILVLNFGGSSFVRLSPAKVQAVAPGGQHKLKDLPRNSRETLEVAQKTSVGDLARELAAAKQRTTELESELMAVKSRAEGLEKDVEQMKGRLAAGPHFPERSIPRKFHHMYLGKEGPPEQHQAWMESCRLFHSSQTGWEYKMWNTSDVLALIQEHEPSYMETWNRFPKHVMKIDAGKYMILKYVGGLYVDTDTECFRESGDLLDGYDLVAQEDYPGAAVNSGVLASKRLHPVWEKAFEIMQERKDYDVKDTGHSTGPQIVRDMILRWHNHTIGASGLLPSTLEKDGGITRVYPFGWWFTPCGFGSRDCHVDFMLNRAAGQVNLTQVAGFHRFTALWLGWRDGLHPQSANSIKEAFCANATV